MLSTQRKRKKKGKQHPHYSQNWVKTNPFLSSVGLGYMQRRCFARALEEHLEDTEWAWDVLFQNMICHLFAPHPCTSFQLQPIAQQPWHQPACGKHEEPFDLMKKDRNIVRDLLCSFSFSLFLMQESIKHIRLTTSVSRRHDPWRQNLLIAVSASQVSSASEKKMQLWKALSEGRIA